MGSERDADTHEPPHGLTRRRLLHRAGSAGLTVGVLGTDLEPSSAAARSPDHASGALPFHGTHQQGIATPQQSALCLMALDLNLSGVAPLRSLMRELSDAALRMSEGRPAQPGHDAPARAPLDSGEALGTLPSRLSITFAFGAGLFRLPGLGSRRPSELRELPPFPGERLDPRHGGGELLIQACADDEMVAFHAIRMLRGLAGERARLRFIQRGFRPARYGSEQTPRNLLGFKDGTLNPRPGQTDFEHVVWVGAGAQPAWMRGGTFMVFRRIRMNLSRWDASSLAEQERTIGRHRPSGAPLGSHHEHDAPDLSARDSAGRPVIPPAAHIRLAHPLQNAGATLLRRGYSYGDGVAEVGPLNDVEPASRESSFDAGLAFIAFMRHPGQFIRIQRQLAGHDSLNEYITHVGSGLYAVPPGAPAGGYVGQTLLA